MCLKVWLEGGIALVKTGKIFYRLCKRWEAARERKP
jgi:hypothetical protein